MEGILTTGYCHIKNCRKAMQTQQSSVPTLDLLLPIICPRWWKKAVEIDQFIQFNSFAENL